MSCLSHFVIYYDSETKQFTNDDGTACARFPEGLIYDRAKAAWVDQGERPYDDLDAKAGRALTAMLTIFNSIVKVAEPEPEADREI